MERAWESRTLVSTTNADESFLGAIFSTLIAFWLLLAAAKQWYKSCQRSDSQRGKMFHASFTVTWIWEDLTSVFLNREPSLLDYTCCWNISTWKSLMETSPAQSGLPTHTCRNTYSFSSNPCKSTRGGVKCFLWLAALTLQWLQICLFHSRNNQHPPFTAWTL